ncbi:Zinc finger and SCAN domain-containing protein 10 [Orchesella cincta]|uniref:Zinc finger and SCAN domain-containing protein 10 n=1 Tax=Orchesella cincta TaxID=48709 RepID=A0A1D2MA05_ORCCI|nr:Zinc finger and SCAN domain-containing protein 10 [Orchesella cincta]
MTSTGDTNAKVQDYNEQGITEDTTILADTDTESAVGTKEDKAVEKAVAENGKGGGLAVSHTCHMCNIGLGSLELIQQHMSAKHPGSVSNNMIFKCEKCGVHFPRMDLYHEHAKLHAEGKVVPPKPDCRPKLRAIEPKVGGSAGITGRLTKSGFGSAISVLRPYAASSVSCNLQGTRPMAIQCPEYHYELSCSNISTLVGPDGQPKYEWIIEVPHNSF